MKFKRLMALALAGVMTLGMAGAVYAQDPIANVNFTKTVDIADAGITSTATPAKFHIEKLDTFTISGEDNFYNTPSTLVFEAKDYTISDLSSTKKTETNNQITSDIKEAINDVPGVYHFKLTETTEKKAADAAFGWTKTDETVYYIRAYVNTDKEYKFGVWNGTEQGPVTKVGEIKFENAYAKKASPDGKPSLTLTKAISEADKAYVDASAVYGFEVKIELPKTAGLTVNATIDGDAEGDSASTITADGTYKVYLKEGKTANFNDLPAGTKVTITELETDKITNWTEADFAGTAATTISTVDKKGTNEFTLGDTQENTVTCTNKFKTITPTGVAINVAPFIAMFAAVGAAIAMYVAARRRVR